MVAAINCDKSETNAKFVCLKGTIVRIIMLNLEYNLEVDCIMSQIFVYISLKGALTFNGAH